MRKATQTFIDDLAEHIVVLQMWAEKREEDIPQAAWHLRTALQHLETAHQIATKGNK